MVTDSPLVSHQVTQIPKAGKEEVPWILERQNICRNITLAIWSLFRSINQPIIIEWTSFSLFDYPTITRNRKSTREVHLRYASDAESTREIHVQRVRSMYNAWDACTPRAKTRENQHLTRNNASGACISRGTYAWDTSHWSIPANHTCTSRVITRGKNATKLYQEIIYVPHAFQNARDTCHKTITGNHICTKRVPKRVGHMPKNYTRNSPIGTQL